MSKVTKPVNQQAVWLLPTSEAQEEAQGPCESRTRGTNVQAEPRAVWGTMRVNFTCQLGWATVPRNLVKHYSDVSVRVFWDEIYI